MELALATNTHPDQWWDTDDAVIATALSILREQARRARGKGGDYDGDT